MSIRPVVNVVMVMAIALLLAFGFAFALIEPFVAPVMSQPPEADQGRLERDVRYLSVDLYPRSFDRTLNLRRARDYIASELRATGVPVHMQQVPVEEQTFQNVIADFGPPSGPVIVIGAHYDSESDANEGSKYPGGYTLQTHTPGADDNASGVAALLELARMLARAAPPTRIELVAYTLEEPPHFGTSDMGSAWHARALTEGKVEVRFMMSLEMLGYYSDESGSQRYPLPGLDRVYPDRGNFIAIVGRFDDFALTRRIKALFEGASRLPVDSINAPAFVEGVDLSDHRNYWSCGFSAVMVTDTAYLRNGNYHAAGDTFEKLDYRRLAEVVQKVYAVAELY